MDNLVSLLKAAGPGAVNDDVKTKILELIQTWATATQGRSELGYIGEVYKSLEREGFNFPPKVDVASSMLDSSAVRSTAPCLSFPALLTRCSLQSGMILMYVCDVEQPSASRTGNTIAGIAEMCLISNAHRKVFPYPILASYNRSESTMAAISN